MRYFTKEWYNDSVVSEMCFAFRKTQKAAIFSDRFFEKLYAVEEKAYLKHCKRAAKFEKRKFDAEASRAEFASNYEENLAFVKENLPEEILSDIADLRVIALGSVTYEMADRITRYCGQLNNKCEAVKRRYEEATDYVAERMGGIIPPLYSELIGAPVSTVSVSDGFAVITTSHEYTGTALRASLRNAEITNCDDGVKGATIIKYELLITEDEKIEFSILASAEDSSLCELTVIAESVEVEEIL